MYKYIAIVLLIATAAAQSAMAETPVRQCGHNKPLPFAVKLDDCEQLPCDVWMGSTSNLDVHFVANKNAMSNIRSEVEVTALGLKMPYELIEERADVCSNLLYGAYCPLDAGEDVVYHLPLRVSANQPEVPSKLEVNLLDRNDNSVVACFLIDVRVKRGARS